MSDSMQWVEADVLALVGQPESARLEFKSGRILEKANPFDDLSKEVSAFANSEGGLLIIGMAEDKQGKQGVASELDGCDLQEFPLHRFQQLLESGISPHLPGIRIRAIQLSGARDGRTCVVVAVPQGATAYQARDRRYYGRSEYAIQALQDHEVRLRMQRGHAKVAHIELANVLSNHRRFRGTRELLTRVSDRGNLEIRQRFSAAIGGEKDAYVAFTCGVRNRGELTLRELAVDCAFEVSEPLSLRRMPDKHEPGLRLPDKHEPGMHYRLRLAADERVYPGDVVPFADVFLATSRDPGRLWNGSIVLRWRAFLDDAAPTEGILDVLKDPGFLDLDSQ